MKQHLTLATCLPRDHERALLIGRVWMPQLHGPVLVHVQGDDVLDLSALAPTCSHLLEMADPVASIRAASALPRIASLTNLLANSAEDGKDATAARLIAPCDLQAIKASGVTFVSSMLERVIEEQARGDPSKAEAVRASIVAVIGDNLANIQPGSPEAAKLKDVLIEQRVWSQY